MFLDTPSLQKRGRRRVGGTTAAGELNRIGQRVVFPTNKTGNYRIQSFVGAPKLNIKHGLLSKIR